MNLKGRHDRYGVLAIGFHWVLAVAILAELPLGLLAAHAPDVQHSAALLRIHVPLGVLILLLALSRLVWWMVDRRPKATTGEPRWRIGAAHLVHVLLYGLPILIGASGVALMVMSGAAPMLFSAKPGMLPRFTDFAPMTVHATSAFLLIGMLGCHLGAVVFHQFVRRDHLLARMGVGSRRADGLGGSAEPTRDAGPLLYP